MPVESVASYINNTFTFVLFILVCTVMFLLALLISGGIRKMVLKRNRDISIRETDGVKGGKSFTTVDPFKIRNTAILGTAFILVFLFLILLLASLYFALNISMGMIVFIMAMGVLAVIAVLVYIFRSGMINK